MVVPNDAKTPPAIEDFGTTVGGLYDTSKGWSMMHYLRDGANLQVLQNATYTFPKGMLVHYDPPDIQFPSGRVNKNQIYLVTNNRTGVNVTNISYSVRIRFVDV